MTDALDHELGIAGTGGGLRNEIVARWCPQRQSRRFPDAVRETPSGE
jgi:hypothetical protein